MRSTRVEINVPRLHHNISVLKQQAKGNAFMAMVKANAYGHGMIDCAREIEAEVDMFGVAVMYEGVMLRLAKISKPIVVMMPPDVYDAEKFCECDLQMVACSLEIMQMFDMEAKRQGVTLKAHLYIDTGMRRDGVEPHDAVSFMEQCKEFSNISIIGVCTHFATADVADKTFTQQQVQKFLDTVDSLRSAGYTFQFIHAANSSAILQHTSLQTTPCNLVRPGLSLYGLSPLQENTESSLALKPVLSLHSRVNALRRISAGESVSYGRRFIAHQETTIATIPIGYGDGYSRMLSGKAECLIHGKRYPIVGTICMDECMIDVGNDAIALGDEVVLYGAQGNEYISVQETATILGTIPYEVTTMITARVPRVLVYNQD